MKRSKSGEAFCSRKCAAQRQQPKMGNLTCPMCGKSFYRKPSERRNGSNYCSRLCSNQAHSQILTAMPVEMRQSPGVSKCCEHCGAQFYAKPHLATKRRFCSKSCAWLHRFGESEKGNLADVSGQNNPNFRGTNNRVTARLNAIKYFGGACMICGWDVIVDVHHIRPRRHNGTNDLDNLIVLCPNHHRMADKKLISADELTAVSRAAIAQLSDRPPLFHPPPPLRDETAQQVP